MYMKKELHRGYNAYINAAEDDLGTQMDVGLLILEPGDSYAIDDEIKESAVLLFEGTVTFLSRGILPALSAWCENSAQGTWPCRDLHPADGQ